MPEHPSDHRDQTELEPTQEFPTREQLQGLWEVAGKLGANEQNRACYYRAGELPQQHVITIDHQGSSCLVEIRDPDCPAALWKWSDADPSLKEVAYTLVEPSTFDPENPKTVSLPQGEQVAVLHGYLERLLDEEGDYEYFRMSR
jgi:hypothetical protein